MEQKEHFLRGISLRRIGGFACNQGFLFFVFYLGLNHALAVDRFVFERVDLVGVLICMVFVFVLLRWVSVSVQKILFARPLLFLSALALAGGSLIYPGDIGSLCAESILVGVPCAFLLAAWGRSLGEIPTKVAVSEVFLASFLAALFSLLLALVVSVGISEAALVFRILPLVSVLALGTISSGGVSNKGKIVDHDSSREATFLSMKIMAGTAFFGVAAGFMETFNTDPGMEVMPTHSVAFLLFTAFALGTLSLLFSDGFGKGAALNKAYRLAIFIMLLGFFLVPASFLVGSTVSGEAVFLAGYLGLTAVLISLFLVLASLTGMSTITSFSKGFAALFGGELVGVLGANAISSAQPGQVTPYDVVIVAGVLVLFSYVFLFSEKDFGNLSEIVVTTDNFETRCELLGERYGLSKREAEVLPYALKGRTSERISQELFISKSTVDTHLRRIYQKAGVHNRQELIDIGEEAISTSEIGAFQK